MRYPLPHGPLTAHSSTVLAKFGVPGAGQPASSQGAPPAAAVGAGPAADQTGERQRGQRSTWFAGRRMEIAAGQDRNTGAERRLTVQEVGNSWVKTGRVEGGQEHRPCLNHLDLNPSSANLSMIYPQCLAFLICKTDMLMIIIKPFRGLLELSSHISHIYRKV